MAKSNLVIVESPAKAKTIGKYLGPDYKVLASMGHVRDLPKSKMGVDLEHNDFEPDYQPIKGKEDVRLNLGVAHTTGKNGNPNGRMVDDKLTVQVGVSAKLNLFRYSKN